MQQARRTQAERTAETRLKLVRAAAEALLELGEAGATVVEICRRAEVTSGTIQHHFGSKGGLMSAVIAYIFEDAIEVPSDRQDASSFDERVDRVVLQQWRTYARPDYPAALEILLTLRRQPEEFARLAAMREASREARTAALGRLFHDVDVDPEDWAARLDHLTDYFRGVAVRGLFAPLDTLRDEALATGRAILTRGLSFDDPKSRT